MNQVTAAKRRQSGGFSLLEVMVVTAMMATVLTTMCVGLNAAHAGSREMSRRAQVTTVSAEIMDRLFHLNFGQASDAPATGAQLSELFDSDANLGSATLSSLRAAPGAAGHKFSIAGFPQGGEFEVIVDADLNGDGDEDDPLEGRSDLLRIVIKHAGTLVLASLRAAPWTKT